MACRKMKEDVAYPRNTESGCNMRNSNIISTNLKYPYYLMMMMMMMMMMMIIIIIIIIIIIAIVIVIIIAPVIYHGF